MLLTPHTLVGAALAVSIPNPVVAVPLSFFMHFMGDLVPHWDFYSNTKREDRIKGWRPLAVMADLAVAVGLGTTFTLYALWVNHNPALALNIFLCGIFSVLPDAMTGPSLYIEGLNGIVKMVHRIQSKLQFQAPLPWGVISQMVVAGFAILWSASSLGLL